MVTKITASDPEALNAAAQLAMQQAMVGDEPVNDESSLVLPETSVTLPGGYITDDLDVVTEAEVRELNGADEEAFARAGTVGKSLLTILERGTVKVGDDNATRAILDKMLAGDRDYLMLQICRATYGDEAEYTAQCPHCEDVQKLTLILSKDIPVVNLEEPTDRFFTVENRGQSIQVQLPTGQMHKEIFAKPGATQPEITTMVLSGCVVSVNDMPSMGISTVKKLGISTRQKIMQEIVKRNPGPRLGEVKKTCTKCEQEMAIPLTMQELFRLS